MGEKKGIYDFISSGNGTWGWAMDVFKLYWGYINL